MKKNSIFLLAGAVVLALGVALLARTLLAPPKPVVTAKAEARPEPTPPRKAILVAARDLQPGEFIDGSHIDWRETDNNPSRSIFFIRGSDTLESLYGATVRQPVEAGQPLTVSMVVRQGEPGFLAAVLKPGMRAVSIPTSRVESNFGLVSSGDRVDVILGLKREDDLSAASPTATAPHLAAQTILRDVRVLALNNQARGEMQVRQEEETKESNRKNSGNSTPKLETVTLEVTPTDAEKLAVAKEVGSLQLALRSARETPDPDEIFLTSGVTTLRATTDLYVTPAGSGAANVQAFRGNSTETISLSGR